MSLEISQNFQENTIKGAAKLYFIHFSHAVIILFSTCFCKSAFSAHSFSKLVYLVSVFLCFLSVLFFEFDVIAKDFWLITQVFFLYFIFTFSSSLCMKMICLNVRIVWLKTCLRRVWSFLKKVSFQGYNKLSITKKIVERNSHES